MSSSNILTIHQISGEIINLIEESKDYCFLVTPYFKPWALLSRSLEKAAKLEKRVVFIFRAGEVSESMVNDLRGFGFDVHFVERLHTKLYLNERSAIISSMNLYDSSKEFNYELGYKFTSALESKRLLQEVIEKDILGLAPKLSFPGRYAQYQDSKKVAPTKAPKTPASPSARREDADVQINLPRWDGYCLRCHDRVQMNPNTPLCYNCFQSWNLYKKREYVESFCHICGNGFPTSMENPICETCYGKYVIS